MMALATKTMTAERTMGSQRAERETIGSLLGLRSNAEGSPRKRLSLAGAAVKGLERSGWRLV
jgi:hypothetical protein